MADDFGKEVRELFRQAEEADRENCEEAITDLKFAAGDQWAPALKAYREQGPADRPHPFPLPCLTINTLPTYIGQVVGDMRANQTSIKVLPRENGDVKVADTRSEIIRSIELQSKASRVYATVFEHAVTCGIGNLRVDIDYASDDAFERDIFIRAIPNPLAVKWDPLAFDPTASDATYCFVGDEIMLDEYKRRFPKAAPPSLIEKECGGGWAKSETVQLPEYWKIDERERLLGLTADGQVIDLTDMPKAKWPQMYEGPDGPQIRKSKCKYAVMVLTNGLEELSKPFEVKLPRLPIIRMTGREIWTDEKRVRFGLVRFARDPQRLKNYNRSIRAEMWMRFPRVNFIAPTTAIEGNGDWENVLTYEGNVAPTEVTSRNFGALINEEQMCAQDMMDTTGIHEASRGMPSNETSGKAILARQQEGDIATIIYHDNRNAAIQETGEVVNTLIDITFDTARTIRAVGADMGVKMIRINDPAHPENVDLSVGRYDVTISTGPSYTTRRQESTAQLMELASRSQKVIDAAPDLIVGEMDLISGDKLKERLKRTVPPQILGDDADDGKDPEELQAQQHRAQQAEQVQEMAMRLEMESKQAATRKLNAEADRAEAEAMKAKREALQGGTGDAQADPMMTLQDIRLKTAQADEAEANAAAAQVSALTALRDLDAGGDPEALQRLQIEAINAITKRIVAINPHILQANEPSPEEVAA